MSEHTCAGCERPLDTDVEGYYAGDGYLCDGCHTSMVEDSPRAFRVVPGEDPDPDDGRPFYYLTPVGVLDRWLEEQPASAVPCEAAWHSTSGWRGYFVVTPREGWKVVSSGWTTGDFADATARSKQAFNDWMAGVMDGSVRLPCEAWFVVARTSNVFSLTVDVLAPDDAELEVPKL